MMIFGGGAPMEGGVVLKKGPWTAAEDETLAAYVREYGEGNWNAVQKKTWLARCGKSCRLRWANHLRPNLRKGSFSADEERLIIQLHSQLGNKWARMAAQLPGRTDNEIKNYWNTRLKRFQRQGLPLYPPNISQINHQQEMYPNKPSSPTPASSFTFQTPSSYPTLQPPSLHPKRCYNTAFGYTGTALSTSTPPFFHTPFLPSSYQSTNPVYSIKPDLPSNQNPYSASLPSYVVGNFADNDTPNQNLKPDLHISTCQLLEDLMEEALGCRDPKRRKLSDAPDDDNNFFSGNLRHFSSSNNLSPQQDLKLKEEESLQINTMQYEDISKLLDWGSESEEISNGQSSVETTEDSLVLDGHQLALLFPLDDENNNPTNMNPTISSYSWDNLPGFC